MSDSILVSGASGLVGYSILKTLRKKKFNLIGTSIYNLSPALIFCDAFEKAPLTSDPCYFCWLNHIIDKYHIKMIIPGIEDDMISWANNKNSIFNTFILINNPNLIKTCSDKWFFYKKIEKCSFAIPTFIDIPSNIKLPIIIKPRRGYGSKGIFRINDKNELMNKKNLIGRTHILQPLIDADFELTVSAFFDIKSCLRAIFTLKRVLSKQGFTEFAETYSSECILDIITKLAKIFYPVGPTNFQFIVKEQNIYLLEINPRISSSTSIRAGFGFNEALMSFDYFINRKKISQPNVLRGSSIRYINEEFFYESTIENLSEFRHF